jgi:hypothetical protein
MKVYLNEKIKPNSSTSFTMDWDSVIPKQIRRSGRNNREGIDMTMTQWYPKIAEYDYDGWDTIASWSYQSLNKSAEVEEITEKELI